MPRKPTRNPTGSIFKRIVRKDGKTITVYDVRKRVPKLGPDGEQLYNPKGKKLYKSKSERCYSHSAALIALGNLPAKIKQPVVTRTRRHSFFELVEDFRARHVKTAVFVRGEKIAGYKKNITHIKTILDEAKTFFGDVSLDEITFDRLGEYKVHLQTTPTRKGSLPAVSTVNEKLAFLNRVLTTAFDKNWIPINPFKKGKGLIRKSRTARRNRMLTFEEETRFLAECIDTDRAHIYIRKGKPVRGVLNIRRAHLLPITIFALDTAMRKAEIQRTQWRQIDFENDVIYLVDEDARETKTGEPGIIPLTARLKRELLDLRDSLPWTPQPTDRVFAFGDFKRAFQNAVRDAKISNLQFRDFRSTGATRMVLAGNRDSQVMKVTRHRDIEVFLDNYTNVDVANAQRIARSLDTFIKDEQAKVNVDLIG